MPLSIQKLFYLWFEKIILHLHCNIDFYVFIRDLKYEDT